MENKPNEEVKLDPSEVQDFKKLVQEWIQMDDNIRKLEAHVKEMKNKKKVLTPVILDFMSSRKITECNNEAGSLKCSKSLRTKPLNKVSIRAKMIDFFKNIEQGDKATKFLLENREKEEVLTLKRTFKRAGKTKE